MKTIFDKINPQHVECATGMCEHTTHQLNTGVLIIMCVALVLTLVKYRHGINT